MALGGTWDRMGTFDGGRDTCGGLTFGCNVLEMIKFCIKRWDISDRIRVRTVKFLVAWQRDSLEHELINFPLESMSSLLCNIAAQQNACLDL